MLEIIALLCLPGALTILLSLSIVDLRKGLLPDEQVMGLMALALVFHLSTLFKYASFEDMVFGGFIGGTILYVVRSVANAYYKEDTLGLGDVKLLGAAGIWLGPESVLVALITGAFAGLVHGLWIAFYTWRKSKVTIDLGRLSIPAGPGFAVGIVIAGIIKFWTFPLMLWP